MPKAPKTSVSKSARVIHPKSRAATHLGRQVRHVEKVERRNSDKATKLGLLGEKLLWFHENIEPDKIVYTKEDARHLIERYLGRFDEELEQIAIKQGIGKHRNHQHIVRKQTIEQTISQEREDYEARGFEIPDILTVKNMLTFREWSKELRYIPNIKLVRVKSDAPAESGPPEIEAPQNVADTEDTGKMELAENSCKETNVPHGESTMSQMAHEPSPEKDSGTASSSVQIGSV